MTISPGPMAQITRNCDLWPELRWSLLTSVSVPEFISACDKTMQYRASSALLSNFHIQSASLRLEECRFNPDSLLQSRASGQFSITCRLLSRMLPGVSILRF
jgi:hypothetical protein